MKTGRSIVDLATELQRQLATKKDYKADTRAIALMPNPSGQGVVLSGINGGMPLRNTAHGQLASSLGIPKQYYDRMLASAPDLLAENVNTWFKAEPKRQLVRTIDGGVRAFLSDRFRPLDNYDLANAILPKFVEKGLKVMSCEVTESRFYLKAVTDRVQAIVKAGDVIHAGVVVSNSEIGEGSLKVSAMDYRLICTNGMIREEGIRRAHLGRGGANRLEGIEDAQEFYRDETRLADDRALFLKVADTLTALLDAQRFTKRINEYRAAADRVIEADVAEVVDSTAKRLMLTGGEQASVLDHLIRGGDLSQWGLANAITRTAEDVTDYDRATELEVAGSKVITLSPSEWRTLAV